MNAEALQKWLWQCVAAGWDPTGGVDSHWSHDDKMYQQYAMENWSLAAVDPLCAKAVALLGKQRVLHPNTKFAFVDEGSKK